MIASLVHGTTQNSQLFLWILYTVAVYFICYPYVSISEKSIPSPPLIIDIYILAGILT